MCQFINDTLEKADRRRHLGRRPSRHPRASRGDETPEPPTLDPAS